MDRQHFEGVGDYRNAEGLITRMLSEHNGVKQGDKVSIDLLALTQVAEFIAEARREPKHTEAMLKQAHELISYIIDDL